MSGDTCSSINCDAYDAVLFDLDGVITNTAKLHARCWKKMFDEYLQKRSAKTGELFQPFEIPTDYTLHVDGKPRFDGVRDFLKSRDIELPDGMHDDPVQKETVWGLGNLKSQIISEEMAQGGIDVYEGTIAFLKHIQKKGLKTAVVSSSENCQEMLRHAKLEDLFDVEVDGTTIISNHLAGKPAPDSYLRAAELLAVRPTRAVVIEDAISGVQAGAHGGFGLVIGVDRHGNAEQLRQNGAHFVVTDLSELIR